MAKYSGPYRSDFPTECVMELAGLLRTPSELVERRQWAIKDWRETSDWALGVTVGDPPDIEQTSASARAELSPNDELELREFASAMQEALPRGEAKRENFAARGWRDILKWIMANWQLILPLILADEK